jgi:hypothetical protein
VNAKENIPVNTNTKRGNVNAASTRVLPCSCLTRLPSSGAIIFHALTPRFKLLAGEISRQLEAFRMFIVPPPARRLLDSELRPATHQDVYQRRLRLSSALLQWPSEAHEFHPARRSWLCSLVLPWDPRCPLLAGKFRRPSAYALYAVRNGRVRRCAIPFGSLAGITPALSGKVSLIFIIVDLSIA